MISVILHHAGTLVVQQRERISILVAIDIHLHAIIAAQTAQCRDPDIVATIFINITDTRIGESFL